MAQKLNFPVIDPAKMEKERNDARDWSSKIIGNEQLTDEVKIARLQEHIKATDISIPEVAKKFSPDYLPFIAARNQVYRDELRSFMFSRRITHAKAGKLEYPLAEERLGIELEKLPKEKVGEYIRNFREFADLAYGIMGSLGIANGDGWDFAAQACGLQYSNMGIRYQQTLLLSEYVDRLKPLLKKLSARPTGDCDIFTYAWFDTAKLMGMNPEVVSVPGHVFMMVGAENNRWCFETTNENPDFCAYKFSEKGILEKYRHVDFISSDPNVIQSIAFHARGIAKYRKRDYEGALKDDDEALRRCPNYVPALCARGNAKENLGDRAGGIADETAAIKLFPEYSEAYADRGRMRFYSGDKKGAFEDVEDAMRLDPGNHYAFNIRGWLKYESHDFKGALDDLDKAIKLEPYGYSNFVDRAWIRYESKDLNGALADYASAIELEPGSRKAYSRRGWIKNTAGDRDGAIEDYTKAIAADSDYAPDYFERGKIKFDKKDLSGAVSDYGDAIRLDPKNTKYIFNRAFARGELKDFDGAVADYTESIRLLPRDAIAFNNRGWARSCAGDTNGAIEDYTEAIRIDPKYLTPYENRRNLRRKNGDLKGAEEDDEACKRLMGMKK